MRRGPVAFAIEAFAADDARGGIFGSGQVRVAWADARASAHAAGAVRRQPRVARRRLGGGTLDTRLLRVLPRRTNETLVCPRVHKRC